MLSLFDGLLVTAPNLRGGTFLIEGGEVLRIDDRTSTGLAVSSDTVVLGLQPDLYELHSLDSPARAVSCPDVHDVLLQEGSLFAIATQQNRVVQHSLEGELLAEWCFDGAEDSMHMNCLAAWGDSVVFSAFGDFTEHRGYKDHSAGRGFVQSLRDGVRRITGLSQPHSLLPVGENLLLANSETFELREYDPMGRLVRSKRFSGYTRGLCLTDGRLYLGLSNSRNAGATIDSACVLALDPSTWQELGRLSIPADEIYSIAPFHRSPTTVHLVARMAARHAARAAASNELLALRMHAAQDISEDASNLLEHMKQLRWWRPRQLSEARNGIVRIRDRLAALGKP